MNNDANAQVARLENTVAHYRQQLANAAVGGESLDHMAHLLESIAVMEARIEVQRMQAERGDQAMLRSVMRNYSRSGSGVTGAVRQAATDAKIEHADRISEFLD